MTTHRRLSRVELGWGFHKMGPLWMLGMCREEFLNTSQELCRGSCEKLPVSSRLSSVLGQANYIFLYGVRLWFSHGCSCSTSEYNPTEFNQQNKLLACECLRPSPQ